MSFSLSHTHIHFHNVSHPPCCFAALSVYTHPLFSLSSSIYLFIYLSIYLPIYLSIHPSIHPSRIPSVCLSVCPSVRPSVHPSIRLSIHPSVYLSVCLSIYLSINKPTPPYLHFPPCTKYLFIHFCSPPLIPTLPLPQCCHMPLASIHMTSVVGVHFLESQTGGWWWGSSLCAFRAVL